MMREATITVPNSYFVKKSDWALMATNKNEPAAELIAVFLYHFDNRMANRILIELIERAIKRHGKYLRELQDWMPYSNAYMRECLLQTHGQNQVVEAIKVLTELKFISVDVPEEIPEFYSKTHSWYRVEIGNIRNWIKTVWFPAINKPSVYSPTYTAVKEAIEQVSGNGDANDAGIVGPVEVETIEATDTETKAVNALGKFYAHIHGKNASFNFDADRRKAVRTQLKERAKNLGLKRAIAICAQAIIGNTKSEFHQAKHPDNMLGVIGTKGTKGRLYDDIGDHIFKNAKKMESMIGHAEDVGVTEKQALNAFEGFLKGTPSVHAKGIEKLQQEAAKLKETANQKDTTESKRYKSFAWSVAGFFKNGDIPNKEILEMCDSNEPLKKQGKELFDIDFLTECLIEALKLKSGEVSETAQTQMREFAEQFCEINELNR